MTKILLKPIEPEEVLAGPLCEKCGAETHLYGIESHPTRARADLRTFVCGQCETVQTSVVPRRR